MFTAAVLVKSLRYFLNIRIFLRAEKLTPLIVIPCTGMHALKPKYLEIDAALNTLFDHFWITVLMPHLKPETLV